jgi:hypothetical protein
MHQSLQTLLQDLSLACQGLSYPSETDAPVSVVSLDRPFPWESNARRVEQITPHEFFAPLAETDSAAAFHNLHQLLSANLKGLTVYRVGDVRIEIFVVGVLGRTTVGVRTEAVET